MSGWSNYSKENLQTVINWVENLQDDLEHHKVAGFNYDFDSHLKEKIAKLVLEEGRYGYEF